MARSVKIRQAGLLVERGRGDITPPPSAPDAPLTCTVNTIGDTTATAHLTYTTDASVTEEHVYLNGSFLKAVSTGTTTIPLTGLSQDTPYSVFVRRYNGQESPNSPAAPFRTTGTTSAGDPLWAGHVPGKAQWGMAVTEQSGSNLQWDDAQTIFSQHNPAVADKIFVRRLFIKSNGNTWMVVSGSVNSDVANELNDAEANGYLAYISFKVPGNDWAGVVAGSYDADLNKFKTFIENRRDAGGHQPFLFCVHHEPNGDGNLHTWGQMQIYLSNFFADVNDFATVAPIGNAFWLGAFANTYTQTMVDIFGSNPSAAGGLVDTLNKNRHVLVMDAYDTNNDDDTPVDGDHTLTKIDNWIAWCRQHGVNSFGIGEWGCHFGAEITQVWNSIKANTDIFHFFCYFNSAGNSRSQWALIPNGYPPDPAFSGQSWNTGGNAKSQGRLDAMAQVMLASDHVYIDGVQQ